MIRIAGEDAKWVMLTIYNRPADYPDQVVVRPWLINQGKEPLAINYRWLFDSVADARTAILDFRPGAVRLPRNPSDARVIVETWF